MAPPREERGSVAEAPPDDTGDTSRDFDPAEAERTEHPDSFDPGLETGYLRRGGRDHELPVEIGATPFDPGPDHYDGRRAKRAAKRREKAERRRRERLEQQGREREERARVEREREAKERRERQAREHAQEEARVRAEGKQREREHELRVQREDREREEREKAARAHDERERLRGTEREERDRQQREREKRKRAERERRDLALKEERERTKREREERERTKREREERERQVRRSKSQTGPVGLTPAPPARAKPRPARVATIPPSGTSLRMPTVKAGLALLGITAVALATGALLGLPLPILGGEDETPSSVPAGDAALLGIDPGTPIGLTKGPFNPVVNPTGYGEAAARFHADRGGRKHEGQDIFGKPGTPLVAARDAIVLDGAGARNFYASGGGNTLVIYSQLDNRSYVYLHMLKPALVKAGDTVSAGQLVGQLGCTGSCDGPHLHFEIRNGRADFGAKTKAIDPLPLLQQWPQRPTG